MRRSCIVLMFPGLVALIGWSSLYALGRSESVQTLSETGRVQAENSNSSIQPPAAVGHAAFMSPQASPIV